MIEILTYSVLVLLSLLLLLHIAILLKLIPYDTIWGGRLKSLKEMYRFEIASVIINLLMLLFFCSLVDWISIDMSVLWKKILLTILAVFFFFNTIGNIKSVNKFETWVFTPLTLYLTVVCALLAYIS